MISFPLVTFDARDPRSVRDALLVVLRRALAESMTETHRHR